MWTTGERALVRGAALAVIAFWCLSATALASFPGHNGSIAFSSFSSELRTTSIFTIQPGRTDPTPLTDGSIGDAFDPAWSPDGSRIAFISEVVSDEAVMVMNEDGSGVVPVDETDSDPLDPSWAPDGTRLAWAASVPGDDGELVPGIVVQGDPEPLVTKDDPDDRISGVAWSPDGTEIAYVWTQRRCGDGCEVLGTQLEVVPAGGGEPAEVGDSDPDVPLGQRGDVSWSPDGKLIAVSFGPGDLRVVSARNGTEPTTIVPADEGDRAFTSDSGRHVAWSPDGSQLVFVGGFANGSNEGNELVVTSPTGAGAQVLDLEPPRTISEGGVDWQPLQAPVTTITAAPAAVTTARGARFEFVATKPPVTFECRLDDQPWEMCASGIEYTGLPVGSHVFAVRATESHGIVEEPPRQHTWRVESSSTQPSPPGQPFPDRTAIRARWYRHVFPHHRVEFRSLRALNVPWGVTIDVRCEGPGCPRGSHRQWRTHRFRASKRVLGGLRDSRLEPSAAVFVTITKPGYIGMGKMYCVRYNRRVRVRPYRLDRPQPTCGATARAPV